MKKIILQIIDGLILPLVWISAVVLKFIRKYDVVNMPLSKQVFMKVGVFPIRDHYYEPMFSPKHLHKPLSEERNLPAIDWNVSGQLELLNAFHFQQEFDSISDKFIKKTIFYFQNGSFEAGDAEYWYNLIRLKKPKRIIEIGSGHSTKMAQLAIIANQKENNEYQCEQICIEPYEMPWLEQIGVKVLRKKVENMNIDFFRQLEANDILFIDSSHVIRPQGDVLFEYLEILPVLKVGVIVHVHDIFTPRNYPKDWVVDKVRLWNEQYLLEAFLSFNENYSILGALNFLCHNYYDSLKAKCPRLMSDNEPGSFYMIKVK